MARSRSFQKSRHYDYESNKRPALPLSQVLADNDEGHHSEDWDDEVESDPVYPVGREPLRFWLSPRTPLDLHRDQRRIKRLFAEDIEFWHYNARPEPIYA
jgi:hypothetical protein